MSLDWVPGLDLSTGTFTLPLWAVGVAAAVLAALAVIAVVRSGVTEFGSLVFRVAVVAIALVFGWTYLNRSAERDRADERHALDQRAADLVGRAIVPGSAIACLEATNTETVEGACERAVFASPETVAAATAYISARLTLLADANDYTSRRDQAYESAIAGLRRTVAADRYGLASQVLATRDGCTADTCDAFSLVYDDKRLRANLKDRLFDVTVARYATNWPTRTRPLASSSPPGPAPAAAAVNPPGPNVSFPSSQSIPPVSIMNAEPPPAASSPPPSPPSPAQSAVQDDGTPKPPTNSAPASASRRPAAKSSAKSAPTGQAPMSLNPTKQ
jgi:membrane protein implicated in regulation of membrane protease activity